jgi:hypothetical protein
MACDSLESLKMVDSQGRNLAVNRRENSDLLDASCGGGGGNFGASGLAGRCQHRHSKKPLPLLDGGGSQDRFDCGWMHA